MLGSKPQRVKLYKRSSLWGQNEKNRLKIQSERNLDLPSSQYRSRSQGIIGAEKNSTQSQESITDQKKQKIEPKNLQAIKHQNFERDILGSGISLTNNKFAENKPSRRGIVGGSESKTRDFKKKTQGQGLEMIWNKRESENPERLEVRISRGRLGFLSGRAGKIGDSNAVETLGRSTQHQSWGIQSLGAGQLGQLAERQPFNQSAKQRGSVRQLTPVIGDSVFREHRARKTNSQRAPERWEDIIQKNQELTARTVDKVLEHGERSAKMLKDCFKEFLNGFRKIESGSDRDSEDPPSRNSSESYEREKYRSRSNRLSRRDRRKYGTRSNRYRSRSNRYRSKGDDSRERGRTVKSGVRNWDEDDGRALSEIGRGKRGKSKYERRRAKKEKRKYEREIDDLREDLRREIKKRKDAERQLEDHLESESDLQRVTKGLEKEIENLKRTIKEKDDLERPNPDDHSFQDEITLQHHTMSSKMPKYVYINLNQLQDNPHSQTSVEYHDPPNQQIPKTRRSLSAIKRRLKTKASHSFPSWQIEQTAFTSSRDIEAQDPSQQNYPKSRHQRSRRGDGRLFKLAENGVYYLANRRSQSISENRRPTHPHRHKKFQKRRSNFQPKSDDKKKRRSRSEWGRPYKRKPKNNQRIRGGSWYMNRTAEGPRRRPKHEILQSNETQSEHSQATENSSLSNNDRYPSFTNKDPTRKRRKVNTAEDFYPNDTSTQNENRQRNLSADKELQKQKRDFEKQIQLAKSQIQELEAQKSQFQQEMQKMLKRITDLEKNKITSPNPTITDSDTPQSKNSKKLAKNHPKTRDPSSGSRLSEDNQDTSRFHTFRRPATQENESPPTQNLNQSREKTHRNQKSSNHKNNDFNQNRNSNFNSTRKNSDQVSAGIRKGSGKAKNLIFMKEVEKESDHHGNNFPNQNLNAQTEREETVNREIYKEKYTERGGIGGDVLKALYCQAMFIDMHIETTNDGETDDEKAAEEEDLRGHESYSHNDDGRENNNISPAGELKSPGSGLRHPSFKNQAYSKNSEIERNPNLSNQAKPVINHDIHKGTKNQVYNIDYQRRQNNQNQHPDQYVRNKASTVPELNPNQGQSQVNRPKHHSFNNKFQQHITSPHPNFKNQAILYPSPMSPDYHNQIAPNHHPNHVPTQNYYVQHPYIQESLESLNLANGHQFNPGSHFTFQNTQPLRFQGNASQEMKNNHQSLYQHQQSTHSDHVQTGSSRYSGNGPGSQPQINQNVQAQQIPLAKTNVNQIPQNQINNYPSNNLPPSQQILKRLSQDHPKYYQYPTDTNHISPGEPIESGNPSEEYDRDYENHPEQEESEFESPRTELETIGEMPEDSTNTETAYMLLSDRHRASTNVQLENKNSPGLISLHSNPSYRKSENLNRNPLQSSGFNVYTSAKNSPQMKPQAFPKEIQDREFDPEILSKNQNLYFPESDAKNIREVKISVIDPQGAEIESYSGSMKKLNEHDRSITTNDQRKIIPDLITTNFDLNAPITHRQHVLLSESHRSSARIRRKSEEKLTNSHTLINNSQQQPQSQVADLGISNHEILEFPRGSQTQNHPDTLLLDEEDYNTNGDFVISQHQESEKEFNRSDSPILNSSPEISRVSQRISHVGTELEKVERESRNFEKSHKSRESEKWEIIGGNSHKIISKEYQNFKNQKNSQTNFEISNQQKSEKSKVNLKSSGSKKHPHQTPINHSNAHKQSDYQNSTLDETKRMISHQQDITRSNANDTQLKTSNPRISSHIQQSSTILDPKLNAPGSKSQTSIHKAPISINQKSSHQTPNHKAFDNNFSNSQSKKKKDKTTENNRPQAPPAPSFDEISHQQVGKFFGPEPGRYFVSGGLVLKVNQSGQIVGQQLLSQIQAALATEKNTLNQEEISLPSQQQQINRTNQTQHKKSETKLKELLNTKPNSKKISNDPTNMKAILKNLVEAERTNTENEMSHPSYLEEHIEPNRQTSSRKMITQESLNGNNFSDDEDYQNENYQHYQDEINQDHNLEDQDEEDDDLLLESPKTSPTIDIQHSQEYINQSGSQREEVSRFLKKKRNTPQYLETENEDISQSNAQSQSIYQMKEFTKVYKTDHHYDGDQDYEGDHQHNVYGDGTQGTFTEDHDDEDDLYEGEVGYKELEKYGGNTESYENNQAPEGYYMEEIHNGRIFLTGEHRNSGAVIERNRIKPFHTLRSSFDAHNFEDDSESQHGQ